MDQGNFLDFRAFQNRTRDRFQKKKDFKIFFAFIRIVKIHKIRETEGNRDLYSHCSQNY